jgi:hypothetical protein
MTAASHGHGPNIESKTAFRASWTNVATGSRRPATAEKTVV